MGKSIPYDASIVTEKLALIKAEVESETSIPLAIKKAGLSRDSKLFKAVTSDPRYEEIFNLAQKQRISISKGIHQFRYRRLSNEELEKINKQCRRTGLANLQSK
jgi:hypothetical protein